MAPPPFAAFASAFRSVQPPVLLRVMPLPQIPAPALQSPSSSAASSQFPGVAIPLRPADSTLGTSPHNGGASPLSPSTAPTPHAHIIPNPGPSPPSPPAQSTPSRHTAPPDPPLPQPPPLPP